jgi:hypothetical protein
MQPFLIVFGSEVGNGLSPFAVNIETLRLVKYCLKQLSAKYNYSSPILLYNLFYLDEGI